MQPLFSENEWERWKPGPEQIRLKHHGAIHCTMVLVYEEKDGRTLAGWTRIARAMALSPVREHRFFSPTGSKQDTWSSKKLRSSVDLAKIIIIIVTTDGGATRETSSSMHFWCKPKTSTVSFFVILRRNRFPPNVSKQTTINEGNEWVRGCRKDQFLPKMQRESRDETRISGTNTTARVFTTLMKTCTQDIN